MNATIKKLSKFIKYSKNQIYSFLCVPIIDGWYGGFWNFRNTIILKPSYGRNLYYAYLRTYNAFIGLNTNIKGAPILPHGLNGIHISDRATIGKDCVIFQQVTIGSNTIKDSKSYGSPNIGDNVYIGAGAKIIGNVHIGNNCRFGANCIVIKDMPDNSTAVLKNIEIILHNNNRDNSFYGINSTL